MSKIKMKPDKKGFYYKNIGFILNSNNKRTQPKFLLGRKEEDATSRLDRIIRLWKIVQQEHIEEEQTGSPVWTDLTLDIATSIAKGEYTYELSRQNSILDHDTVESRAWSDADFAGWVRIAQDSYGAVIGIIADDTSSFQNGVNKNLELAHSYQEIADSFARDAMSSSPRDISETLHKAFRAFSESIDSNPKYKNPNSGPGIESLTAWGYKLKSYALDMIERYPDRPLSDLHFDQIQEMFNFWRQRPNRKGTTNSIKIKTVKHRITVLKLFFKWLNLSGQFKWRKPADFEDLEVSVKTTREEKSAKAKADQVETFMLDQLRVIYRSTTTPLERLLFLCGLNFGFKAAEIGTLSLNEVILNQVHPHGALLEYNSTHEDGYVKRIRQKTGVYAEFKCWPASVEALKWLIKKRAGQQQILNGKDIGSNIQMTSESVLLLNQNGLPMYRVYKSGNTSQEIPKVWNRLIDRVREVNSTIPKYTYSALRRSTANWIRQHYDAETSKIFLSHGTPYVDDDLLDLYSNRPFAKVFKALDALYEILRSDLECISDPFPTETKKGGSNLHPKKIEQIQSLLELGMSKIEIAKKCGVSRQTVYRYVD